MDNDLRTNSTVTHGFFCTGHITALSHLESQDNTSGLGLGAILNNKITPRKHTNAKSTALESQRKDYFLQFESGGKETEHATFTLSQEHERPVTHICRHSARVQD